MLHPMAILEKSMPQLFGLNKVLKYVLLWKSRTWLAHSKLRTEVLFKALKWKAESQPPSANINAWP